MGANTGVLKREMHPRLICIKLVLRQQAGMHRPTAAATDAAAPGLLPVNIATTTPQLCSSCTAAAASGRGLSAKARYPATDLSMAAQQIDAPAGREHSKVNESKGARVKGAYAPKGDDIKCSYLCDNAKLFQQAAAYRAKGKGTTSKCCS